MLNPSTLHPRIHNILHIHHHNPLIKPEHRIWQISVGSSSTRVRFDTIYHVQLYIMSIPYIYPTTVSSTAYIIDGEDALRLIGPKHYPSIDAPYSLTSDISSQTDIPRQIPSHMIWIDILHTKRNTKSNQTAILTIGAYFIKNCYLGVSGSILRKILWEFVIVCVVSLYFMISMGK